MFRRGNPRRVYTSLVPSPPMAKRLLFAPKIARVRGGRVLVFSMILHKRIVLDVSLFRKSWHFQIGRGHLRSASSWSKFLFTAASKYFYIIVPTGKIGTNIQNQPPITLLRPLLVSYQEKFTLVTKFYDKLCTSWQNINCLIKILLSLWSGVLWIILRSPGFELPE